MAKKLAVPSWTWMVFLGLGVVVYLLSKQGADGMSQCPGSQVYCPGVGCLSGSDKCVAGSAGGPSAVFSKETFASWPGAGHQSTPPNYSKEGFTSQCRSMKACPGGTRSDGPCLMEFPSF